MYEENDQLVLTNYEGGMPDEELYRQLGFPRSSVTPVMVPMVEINKEDLYSKPWFKCESVEELIEDIEGEGVLNFRYDGENIEMGSKFVGVETEFEVSDQGEDELRLIENILSERSNDSEYTWTTNANSYLSMEDLRDGMSSPVHIDSQIQGVESLLYQPNSKLGIRHFKPEMVVISDDYMESIKFWDRDVTRKILERRFRKQIYEQQDEEMNLEFRGQKFPIQEEDWEIVEHPVNEGEIERIQEELEAEGIGVDRVILGPSQQPRDTSPVTTDFERV